MSNWDETLKVLQIPDSGRVLLYACVPGAMLYLTSITPQKLRDLADQMDRMMASVS